MPENTYKKSSLPFPTGCTISLIYFRDFLRQQYRSPAGFILQATTNPKSRRCCSDFAS